MNWNEVPTDGLMAAIDTTSARAGRWRPSDLASVFPSCVLDFGCGVGRNVAQIRSLFGVRVIGFDVPQRIEHHVLPDLRPMYYRLTSDFDEVLTYRIHTVVAWCVFQHIPAPELVDKVQQLCLAAPTHRLMIHTRWWTDDQHHVHRLLAPFYHGVPLVPDEANLDYHWSAVLTPKCNQLI